MVRSSRIESFEQPMKYPSGCKIHKTPPVFKSSKIPRNFKKRGHRCFENDAFKNTWWYVVTGFAFREQMCTGRRVYVYDRGFCSNEQHSSSWVMLKNSNGNRLTSRFYLETTLWLKRTFAKGIPLEDDHYHSRILMSGCIWKSKKNTWKPYEKRWFSDRNNLRIHINFKKSKTLK